METQKKVFSLCNKNNGKSDCCGRVAVRTNVKAGAEAETEAKKPVEPYVVKITIPHGLL
ncbi:MAG: hypothetical protein Q3M24_04880 [Candidatus Electrothrix aestuarii]|uniref:Uncharacterized protein n=1 Tax=Candidatus Electrothrix aestuarii TaxID=3062594 RepID=A0AAU8LXS9_9BACT|nr:hypothetical protein [Candidatus Electrothrix aestuarii]